MDLEKKPSQPPKPVATGPGALRASDADRDRIADILRDALAEGRLTAEEHSERIEGVYRAKTVGELEPLVGDLPAPGARGAAAGATGGYSYDAAANVPAPAEDTLVACFSSSTRVGRWRVSRRTKAFAVFGNVEIDLTEAYFEHQHVVIEAVSVFGNVEVRVPENITLRGNGSGVLGNFEIVGLEADNPSAPVVTVKGWSVLGNIEARPKRGKRVHDLHKRLRKHLH
ncbi:DUF1707 domain-containing protein [Streptomyces sp. NPDC060194]|uniref:DUF1707 SHOCT-like domain-containing protein n=1 Tax=Streptomyces sp. NPDC060194 TaxID=3347069 RepID=UPI00365B77B4